MPRNLPRFVLIMGSILFAILACDLPGTAADPAAQFYPSHTAAVRTLEAMMTANAARATDAALTNAPSPTGTPLPSTETPASTDTPPDNGTRITRLSDNTTLYSDYDAGFEIVFSSIWLAMRPYQSEYYEAWGNEAAANPDFAAALTRLQGISNSLTRVYALDTNTNHIKSGTVSNIVLNWDPNDTLPLDKELEGIVATYKKTQGVKVVASGIGLTALKLPIAIIEYSQTTKSLSGASITLYQKVVIFRARKGAAAVTLTIPRELRDPLLTNFDQALNSVTLVGP